VKESERESEKEGEKDKEREFQNLNILKKVRRNNS
jgi:hypothetical protein